MEHKLIYRSAILSLMVFAFSFCTKIEDTSETANQRFLQSMDWNKNNSYSEIVVPTDDYLILAMGDCHVGGTKNLDLFFKIAMNAKASAVVLAGDLTSGRQEDYDVFEQHLPVKDSLTSFLIAGNHDMLYGGWKEYYKRFGSSSYLFSIKTPEATDLFICLETGAGTLGDKQLKWLTNILETQRPFYRHCIVFTHNNFIRSRHTDSTNPPVEELEVLLDLFAKHGVDMVVTGHDHKQDSVKFGITTYIIMDALKDGLSNAGYFQITLKKGEIGYEFENL